MKAHPGDCRPLRHTRRGSHAHRPGRTCRFGRLTNWATPLQARPKWWGKLVTELIYDTMDEDVAEYPKENKLSPGVRWHRQYPRVAGESGPALWQEAGRAIFIMQRTNLTHW